MLVREVLESEKDQFDSVVSHPLQSWAWGEFRKKIGTKVVRLGIFEDGKLKFGYQVFFHLIPRTKLTIGYFPKGHTPDGAMLKTLRELGRDNSCIFIKLEPSILFREDIVSFLLQNGCRKGRSLFAPHTFLIDLTKTEEELLSQVSQKTRYNVRLAQRKGVIVTEDNSPETFEVYLKLLKETTRRDKFYAHDENYHRRMWETLNPAGIAHLLVARYKGEIITTWIFFVFGNVLYYPYGASTRKHREVMASNLLMWEGIRFGKKAGCKTFDMWGSLGPDADSKDPWYGFHRFKKGYGGKLVEFVGTYDLVINPLLYRFYNLADSLRWTFLRFKPR